LAENDLELEECEAEFLRKKEKEASEANSKRKRGHSVRSTSGAASEAEID